VLLREGNGVAPDRAAAMALLHEAALQGHITAEVEYAIALFNGTGVTKDEAAAARLFRKAALSGNAIAQNRYARLLS
ncbi:sel1 repeat family protein, partial [Klebsiella pneumoniae]|nr:sel1 repeat family protein [Klebsiella pneumoniae]